MTAYTIGARVEVRAEFSDPDTLQPVDPTTVRLRVRLPDGVLLDYTFGTDPEIAKAAVGDYRSNLDLSLNGRWDYYWNSSGSGQAAAQGSFTVQAAKALQ